MAQPALVNGVPGAVWLVGGQPRVVFAFTITAGQITAIALISDPTVLAGLSLRI